MERLIKLLKSYFAYILCIVLLPVWFVMDIGKSLKGAFWNAWAGTKHSFKQNNRYLKINLKMLDI